MSKLLFKDSAFFIQPVANIVSAIATALRYSPYIQNLYGGGSFKTTNVNPYNRDDNAINVLSSISIFQSSLGSTDDYYGYKGVITMYLYDPVSYSREYTLDNIDNRLSVVIDTIQNPNFTTATELFLLNYNDNIQKFPQLREILKDYAIIDSLGTNLTADFGYDINLGSGIGMAWKSIIKFNYLLSKEGYRSILQELGAEIYYDPNKTTTYPKWEDLKIIIEED